MAERLELRADDALVAIDVQNDFCPGGALAVPRGDEVVPVINRLTQRFPHVVLTQDWHPRGHVSFASSHPGRKPFERIQVPYGEQVLWPDHCVPGTPGAELHRGLDTLGADIVVRKGSNPAIDSYSALYENDHRTRTGLAGYLRERGCRRLFLAGHRLLRAVLGPRRAPGGLRGLGRGGRRARHRPRRLARLRVGAHGRRRRSPHS
jgi:nicotinamidase/pyrazinamidase